MYYKSEYIGKTVSASQWLNFLYQLNRTTIIGSNFLTRNSLTLHSFSKHVRFNAYLSSMDGIQFQYFTNSRVHYTHSIDMSFIHMCVHHFNIHACKSKYSDIWTHKFKSRFILFIIPTKANVCFLCQLCKKVIKFSCVTHVCKILIFRWQIKVKLSLSSDGMTWVCV